MDTAAVSHAAGRSDLVLPLARAAVAAGVMVEVHPQPEDALRDGLQQIRVGELARFADESARRSPSWGRPLVDGPRITRGREADAFRGVRAIGNSALADFRSCARPTGKPVG